MLGYMILIVLVINMATFYVVARSNKQATDRGVHGTGPNDSTTYLICGGAFPYKYESLEWLLDNRNTPLKGGVHTFTYQNFGFDPRVIAEQLECDIEENHRSAILITMSLGSEIPFFMERSKRDRVKHIAIDPCLGRQTLENGPGMHALAILLKIAVFLLGWLAYLPVISGQYSLALFADCLYWATRDFRIKGDVSLDGAIISTRDRALNTSWLEDSISVEDGCGRKIPCCHDDIEIVSNVYVSSMNTILQRTTNFSRFSA